MADPLIPSLAAQVDGRVHLSFAEGVDNRSHPKRMDAGFVRVADNVDIDNDGIGTRREGYDQWVELPGAHSLWTHPLLTFALVADASQLYRLDDNATLTSLITGLNGGRISAAVPAQKVCWSNGVETGQVDLSGDTSPLGVETPVPSFGVTSTAAGGLFAGRYGVTMSFCNAFREEGGAPDTVFVDVAEGGGIQVSNVPVSDDGSATLVRVWVTEANGTDLLLAGTAAAGAATFLIGAGLRTRTLTTQFCEPFPPAMNLLAKAGHLLGSIGRDLVWSAAMFYGLWRPTENSLRLPDEITMIAAPDGPQFVVFIATRKKTYLWQGDSIDNAQLSVACAAGAIPGSMVMLPSEVLRMDGVTAPVPAWAGTDGVPYLGLPTGVIPLTHKFAYPIYDQAAAAFVQQGGMSRWIVSGRGGRDSALAMGDRVSATVIEAGP